MIAIDPGDVESAWVYLDPTTRAVNYWAKEPNEVVLDRLGVWAHANEKVPLAIEMIASYGMPVGKEVFETCVWIGQFEQRWCDRGGPPPRRVYRREVKMHLCGNNSAKDSNVRQALIDMYGPGKERAVGLKATPGPLYGLSGDGWAALGVAVTALDT